MRSVVTEPLSHSESGKWCEVLKGRGLGSCGSSNDGVLHSVVLLEGPYELGDGRMLLTDGDADAVKLLILVRTIVPPLLVKDGIDSDGGLSGLTIIDDQLVPNATGGHQGVDGARRHGLVDGTTG